MMKNFHLTVSFVITCFVLIMVCVAGVAFKRPSNSTGIDPAQIKQLRER